MDAIAQAGEENLELVVDDALLLGAQDGAHDVRMMEVLVLVLGLREQLEDPRPGCLEDHERLDESGAEARLFPGTR